MKIPRNISGNKLAKLLEVYGYRITSAPRIKYIPIITDAIFL